MNMITALLGATGLLLVVAVTILTARMMNNSNDTDEAEIKRLRAELAVLNAQQSQLNPPAPAPPLDPGALAADPIVPIPASIPPSPPISAGPSLPEPNPGEVVAGAPATTPLPSIISENPASGDGAPDRAQLEAELAEKERKNELRKKEDSFISKEMIERAEKQKRRASTVKIALLQAKVVEWVARQPDQESGGFAIIELHRDIQPGTFLSIRRQTGIYGQLQVDHLYPEKKQASANPVRGTFPDGGAPVIKPGDELILPPFGS